MRKKYRREKVVFFGCGKCGVKELHFWRTHEKEPIVFCDNDELLWGTQVDGIDVISPSQLRFLSFDLIIVTVREPEEVISQLVSLGYDSDKIVPLFCECESEGLYKIAKYLYCDEDIPEKNEKNDIVMLDLACGMVLGGVERWCYELAKKLRRWGIKCCYLLPIGSIETIEDDTCEKKIFGKSAFADFNQRFDDALNMFKNFTGTIICNFPFEAFRAACVAKMYDMGNFKLIAVIHNDEEVYYNNYAFWKNEIDYCIVISDRIKKNIIERGIPENKVIQLLWYNDFPRADRIYAADTEPLRIAYAGRISYAQKRVDRLVNLAVSLRDLKINFRMTIAGEGDYTDSLTSLIYESGVEKFVNYVGLVEHEKIYQFWCNQDVFISCSDYEGHSISQTEAMAMGAVPVVTNTSGAEDDIVHGRTGFLVEIDRMDNMAYYVAQLSRDRNLLRRMGEAGSRTIRLKNDPKEEKKLWTNLIKKTPR